MSARVLILVILVILVIAACADDSATPSDAPGSTTSPTPTTTATTQDTAGSTTVETGGSAPGGGPDATSLAARLCAEATGGSEHDVANSELDEISGIGVTVARDGGLWVHNDSGDSARVFGIGLDGSDGGQWALADVDARDWEDMAVGPGPDPGRSYLYLADIGDNDEERDEITVHRVVEPDWGASGTITDVDSFTMTYEDRPHNAESFLVDPLTTDWYVITKGPGDGTGRVFRTPAPSEPGESGETLVLRQVATVDLRAGGLLATGADASPDGSLVAVRTYSNVLVFPRPAGAPLESAFAAEPCLPPVAQERKGEAVAFLGTSGYVTISEGDNPPVNIFRTAD